jgi:uncharacterized protein (DUF58 family)
MSGRLAFPLISRRRLAGSPLGTQRSMRRGRGSETAGTRAYLPGDPIATIEWAASARLSAARGSDEFIVRERFAEEAPVVAIVLDRRPSMGIYDAASPWLDKPAAASVAVRAIVESADAIRAAVGVFDANPAGSPFVSPARGRPDIVERTFERTSFDAPDDALEAAVRRLAQRRRQLPAGSFVFVISDFLGSFGDASRALLRSLRCEIVPVLLQDPTWERSYPDVWGVLLPIVDVATGEAGLARLTHGEVVARRDAHEARFAELVRRFRGAGMDPVVLDDADPQHISEAFRGWAARRQRILRQAR